MRKELFKYALGYALCSSIATLCATEAELLPNPGFDHVSKAGQPADWQVDAGGINAAFSCDASTKKDSAASMRIVVPPGEMISWPNLSAKIPAEPGQSFLASVNVKCDDVTKLAYSQAEYCAADGSRLGLVSSPGVAGTKDWKKISLKMTVPAGTKYLVYRLILTGAGTAWFDGVSLIRDVATEEALLSVGKQVPLEWLQRALTSDGNNAALSRLMQRAKAGGRFTVGILGGSITQGASASSKDLQYSGYVMDWWRSHFPAAKFELVNAGIGSTGSDFGAMRVQRDLLSKDPDFVIVEYAVNDKNTKECAESYEGVIRQILALPKKPAVMLMFFMLPSTGECAQEWQSKVGKHYGLPMVSYHDLLWPEIEAKRMPGQDISFDAIHPNDLGHVYAGKLLCAMLDRALAASPTANEPPMPAPLLTDLYQFTSIHEANNLKPIVNEGWILDAPAGADKCWKSSVPGSVIEFDIAGERIFLTYLEVGGPMGKAKVTVDHGEPTILDAWADRTWGVPRMAQIGKDKPGIHRVRIELLADKSMKSTGNEFKIIRLAAAGVKP